MGDARWAAGDECVHCFKGEHICNMLRQIHGGCDISGPASQSSGGLVESVPTLQWRPPQHRPELYVQTSPWLALTTTPRDHLTPHYYVLSSHKTFRPKWDSTSIQVFYTPVWKTGRIMPWQCPSVRLSVRPSVRPSAFSGLFFNMLWDINLKLGIYIQ